MFCAFRTREVFKDFELERLRTVKRIATYLLLSGILITDRNQRRVDELVHFQAIFVLLELFNVSTRNVTIFRTHNLLGALDWATAGSDG